MCNCQQFSFSRIRVRENFQIPSQSRSFTSLDPFPHNDTFWWLWERSLLKTLCEKEKLHVQAISHFPTMFSALSKTEIVIFFICNLSSANAFNLVWSQIFSCGKGLTLSSIYTHFSTLKKKALGKHCGKRWNCSNWAISHFYTLFSMQSVSLNPLLATFQLLSATSLNLGLIQNGILGNVLNWILEHYLGIIDN